MVRVACGRAPWRISLITLYLPAQWSPFRAQTKAVRSGWLARTCRCMRWAPATSSKSRARTATPSRTSACMASSRLSYLSPIWTGRRSSTRCWFRFTRGVLTTRVWTSRLLRSWLWKTSWQTPRRGLSQPPATVAAASGLGWPRPPATASTWSGWRWQCGLSSSLSWRSTGSMRGTKPWTNSAGTSTRWKSLGKCWWGKARACCFRSRRLGRSRRSCQAWSWRARQRSSLLPCWST
mmetsp:Transcript_9399/g.22124  ORF Transcript_9399/g.22124 Transcript_9399/m.22124 type:complete len:236 (+) Transcript_9399:277-984(+)